MANRSEIKSDEDAETDAGAVPFWRCESCGHSDYGKPLPKDRAAYYANPKPGKCPKCKSDDMAPVGF